jgi:hypothetical protein
MIYAKIVSKLGDLTVIFLLFAGGPCIEGPPGRLGLEAGWDRWNSQIR